MVIKSLDKITTKCSLEDPFLENLISIGIVFELKTLRETFLRMRWVIPATTHSTKRLSERTTTHCRANNSDRDIPAAFESLHTLL